MSITQQICYLRFKKGTLIISPSKKTDNNTIAAATTQTLLEFYRWLMAKHPNFKETTLDHAKELYQSFALEQLLKVNDIELPAAHGNFLNRVIEQISGLWRSAIGRFFNFISA